MDFRDCQSYVYVYDIRCTSICEFGVVCILLIEIAIIKYGRLCLGFVKISILDICWSTDAIIMESGPSTSKTLAKHHKRIADSSACIIFYLASTEIMEKKDGSILESKGGSNKRCIHTYFLPTRHLNVLFAICENVS